MTDDDFPSVWTLRFIYKWHKQLFMFSQIKLVNINIPDIIEGKPSIILGLIWTIILHCHVRISMKRQCVFTKTCISYIHSSFFALSCFFSSFTLRPLFEFREVLYFLRFLQMRKEHKNNDAYRKHIVLCILQKILLCQGTWLE